MYKRLILFIMLGLCIVVGMFSWLYIPDDKMIREIADKRDLHYQPF